MCCPSWMVGKPDWPLTCRTHAGGKQNSRHKCNGYFYLAQYPLYFFNSASFSASFRANSLDPMVLNLGGSPSFM